MIAADIMITHAIVVTMDPLRRVILDGAVAWKDDVIVAVGKTANVEREIATLGRIDGRRFVVTPGLVNSHIHIVGEPLTRGYVPDDTDFHENVLNWLIPFHKHYTPADERLSAQLSALEMLRSGTTSFIEAGSLSAIDEVADGLNEIGIRGRIALRVWDQSTTHAHPAQETDSAVRLLESELARFPSRQGQRIAAWPTLIGHFVCSDALWQAAKVLSIEHGTGLSFHMSPHAGDVDWHLQKFGRRPLEHLADLGVLSTNAVVTHAVHVNDSEIALLAQTGASVAHCPTTALKVAYGVTQVGRFPEMVKAGVNVAIGTDGNNASNYADMMRATYLVAGLFKDARRDPTLFPAEQAYAMATLAGAKALGLDKEIGSLEVGKKADLVLHDTDRPEWRPLLNVANQLVWSADGRSVHSVFVDGRRVVDDYRCTTIDEHRLYERAQSAALEITRRSGLPLLTTWSVQ
jgi:5-methylthioadenosine/S-adenosylhomocysteine deaminase